jgi:ABC-type transporter Mla subunit MlaD
MKIKRFTESVDDETNISPERIGEMIEELRNVLSSLDNKKNTFDTYLNELSNYISNSKKGNDQIDDSIATFQIIKKNIEESIEKTDTVINNLISYNDEGRSYLYTENK